jgi:Sec-independent protein translocase protein TatA
VGFGTEILFIIVLGVLLVGPKRLPAILGHLARAKAQFEKATQSFRSHIEAELEAKPDNGEADSSQGSRLTS